MNYPASCLKMFFLICLVATMLSAQSIFRSTMAETLTDPLELPETDLNLTADMKVVFLGIPEIFINESRFLSGISQSVSQFAFPNNMTWTLNVSISFPEFPQDVMLLLENNTFHSEDIAYYNVTLLDSMLPQSSELVMPKHGYCMTFMWIPDDRINHSWFFVPQRPDLFLGRIDYFDGVPLRFWAFPSNFGGLSRALYFDISEIMEGTPTELLVTETVVGLFNYGLDDIFPDLLGVEDSSMIQADEQRYEQYKVRILWFNGTGEQFYPKTIEKSFRNLMPWTNWTVTMETRIMDTELNDLIDNRTEELLEPLNYSFVLSNGTSFSISAQRNVMVDFYADSGEYDPLIQFFFNHVKDYFNLTDLEDKSVIPVVFLQLRNDTAFGGAPQAGVSWFLKNVVVVGFQGSWLTEMGESGSMFLTHILRHEIGHWLSLSHHSSQYEFGDAKIICPMSSFTNHFCAFCKDARARMSFISYYNATIEALSRKQSGNGVWENDLDNALQLFYDWQYVQAIQALISVYHKVLISVYEFQVNVDGYVFSVSAETNSTMSGFTFDKDNRTVKFNVEGIPGSTGFCNLTIPTTLLGGPYTVNIDTKTLLADYNAPTNQTHAVIYFTYNHSTHLVEIEGTTVVPEFPRLTILSLLILATSIAVIVCRRRQ